jgi:hypothetical protein
MNLVEDVEIECPQCGEAFAIQVDTEAGDYDTVEDCAVCCRPMAVSVRCVPGRVLSVDVEAA